MQSVCYTQSTHDRPTHTRGGRGSLAAVGKDEKARGGCNRRQLRETSHLARCLWPSTVRKGSLAKMRSVFSLLVLCLAGASAFVALPAVQQQQLSTSRSAFAPTMAQSPARVEIELEDGEP